jgi:hypothetical protein
MGYGRIGSIFLSCFSQRVQKMSITSEMIPEALLVSKRRTPLDLLSNKPNDKK